jgi:hypothetical protein
MALLIDRASSGLQSAYNRARRRYAPARRRCRAAWILGLVVLGLTNTTSPAQSAAQAAVYTEYQVKAAFLFNFAKFVDWPAEAFADADAPITIGIFGEDPFGATLEQIVAGQNVRGRPLALVHYRRVRDIGNCQILFVSATEERAAPQVLDKVRDASVLTVSEVDNFARDGGIVNFVLRENRVRFEINVDAAERARLRISSKLLKLADVVRDGQPR